MKKFNDNVNMDICYFTYTWPVERHHVFPGYANRKKCDKYGFVVPLAPALHPNGVYFDPERGKDVNLCLRQICQKWYEENIGTREDFISEFGKNYFKEEQK